MKTYRGHPGPNTITVEDGGGPRILKPKNEEIGFAWGPVYAGSGPGQLGAHIPAEDADKIRQAQRNRAAGINQTVLAIATDLLGSEDDAIRVYQRLKHRTVFKWPPDQSWVITESQLRREIESIEQIERETEPLRRMNHMREVVNEGGGGIVWDTDIDGRRRGPR